ncbi:MAG: sulfatase [candidate division Zixibacteria bacterium]|nr:sulfatase [Phycisphaerae bacterium]NIR64965.1 sulfatase [candidate division Zixibacteria bacterium]NIP55783.1 sulfatase [Phycisphaerae bacterium]NIS54425.1 sulfatase [Phycisphaerae bacterium]NIU07573.1 sulfatase [Phycisphaerae bacterium]
MDRREFLKTVGIGGILGGICGRSLGAGRRRPNILFMFADDQAQSCLGYAGNKVIKTPNMDRLAEEGVYFENAFVTTAICCSSRASILTGQYTRRHGIIDFHKPLSAEAFAQSYPVLLRKAGYRTGYLGKFAVGWPNRDIRHLSLPADQFDYWYGFPQVFGFEQKIDGKSRYLTSVMTEKAIDFLRTNPADKPFCLTIAFKEPHGPFDYFDPDFPNPYEDLTIPPAKTLTKDAYEKVPGFIRHSLNGTGDKVGWLANPRSYQKNLKTVYALISRMDLAVGQIMSALRKLGLDDNTIVIWSSDHGSLLGAHGLKGKWLMYEESIRIPLIIRDGRQSASRPRRRAGQMALNIDLAPTMLDFASVPIPAGMQGRSLAPIVAGSGRKLREDFYYEHFYEHKGNIRPTEGVRTGKFKYVRFPKENPVYEQLFNLSKDPCELEDLAKDADHQATLRSLRRRCDAYRRQLL